LAYVPAYVLDSPAECGNRIQSHAGTVEAFNSAVHIGCLHAGNHTGQTCSSGSRLIVGVFVRNEWHVTIVGSKWHYRVRANQERQNGHKKGHENVSFWVLDGFTKTSTSSLERMVGTTRLELATSAVTVSHWKYTTGIAIVYRDVYRGSSID
jgi:hypothetical protein